MVMGAYKVLYSKITGFIVYLWLCLMVLFAFTEI